MNFIKVVALCLFAAIIATGCTSTGTVQVLSPEYQNRAKEFNTSVTIFPPTEDFVERETWQKYLELDAESQSLITYTNLETFKKYFGLSFSETTTGIVHNVMTEESIALPDDIAFQSRTLPLTEKKNLMVLIPENGKLLADGVETDFSLLIESMKWELEHVEQQSKPVGGSNQSFMKLDIKFKYVLWDNRRESVAGYGLVRESHTLLGSPDRITYIQIFEKISRDIVKMSPLQERYIR